MTPITLEAIAAARDAARAAMRGAKGWALDSMAGVYHSRNALHRRLSLPGALERFQASQGELRQELVEQLARHGMSRTLPAEDECEVCSATGVLVILRPGRSVPTQSCLDGAAHVARILAAREALMRQVAAPAPPTIPASVARASAPEVQSTYASGAVPVRS